MNTLTSLVNTVTPDLRSNTAGLQAAWSPDLPWSERQEKARMLGRLGSPAVVNTLIAALPNDPFWMVRCSIILALQQIGDPAAIPVLKQVATDDGFQAVRSHARQAVEQFSS